MSMQNPNFGALPPDDADEELATREVDDEPVVDTDANADLIDSAEADRLAAENGDDPDEP